MNRNGKHHRKRINKRKILFERCGGICPGCGKKMQYKNPQSWRNYMTIDHIYPLSRGGSNNLNNMQGMCQECNLKKGSRIVSDEKDINEMSDIY